MVVRPMMAIQSRPVPSHMKMGNQTVKQEQKQHAAQKPIKAGDRKDSFPISSDCSMAGIVSRLQIDAATITPAAKPAHGALHQIAKGFFHIPKNTQAAPAFYPRK